MAAKRLCMLRLADNPKPRWPADRTLTEDSGNWWVARVKPRHEKALARDLSRLKVGYYLPMMTKRTIRRDNGKPRKSVICLFPGYISLTGYQEKRNEIHRTGRIFKVIQVIDQDRFVEELESVRKALDYAKEVQLHPRLAVGQLVMIVSGPLQGIQGVVADRGRSRKVYLNVEMFNKAVTVTVLPDQLCPLEDELSIKIAGA